MMAYNHGYEEKKFKLSWSKQKMSYQKAGMTEEQIQVMYQFEREVFNSDRRYLENKEDFQFGEVGDSENETLDAKLKNVIEKNINTLSIDNGFDVIESSFSWIESLEDENLFDKVKKLNADEQELLQMFAIEEKTVVEIAKIKKVAHQTISKKITRIKLKLAE